jgi:hypothetical protein
MAAKNGPDICLPDQIVTILYSYKPGIKISEHLKTRFLFVQFSNSYSFQMFAIQIPTLPVISNK